MFKPDTTRTLDCSARYKLNTVLLNQIMELEGLGNIDPIMKVKFKRVVRYYCAEDLIETLIAVNQLKRCTNGQS